jgi:branched-chain amino acid transport system ATP-binding protein
MITENIAMTNTGKTPIPKDSTDREILKVSDVSKDFEGVRALDQVGFSVQKGDIKALIGPNGAGKTTLLNVINGLLAPTTGQVNFKGHDLVGKRPDKIALLGISRTFQLIRLFSVNNATVLDNVMIGAHKSLKPSITESIFSRPRMKGRERAIRDKAFETLRLVGLEDSASMQPGALSFGNQRLVELARSLMADPDLLLLDEPASGLNDSEVDAFMELLSVIKSQGITVLLVEHNMKLVMNSSDDVVVIDFGKWIAEGPPSEISVNPQVVQAYLGDNSLSGDQP